MCHGELADVLRAAGMATFLTMGGIKVFVVNICVNIPSCGHQVELICLIFEGCYSGNSEEPVPVGVPSHDDVRAAVLSDSEATSSSMVLEVKQVILFNRRIRLPQSTIVVCLRFKISDTLLLLCFDRVCRPIGASPALR